MFAKLIHSAQYRQLPKSLYGKGDGIKIPDIGSLLNGLDVEGMLNKLVEGAQGDISGAWRLWQPREHLVARMTTFRVWGNNIELVVLLSIPSVIPNHISPKSIKRHIFLPRIKNSCKHINNLNTIIFKKNNSPYASNSRIVPQEFPVDTLHVPANSH